MKFELLVFLITGFFIANTYYDGKYLEKLKTWKKYYQMAGIGFAGLSMYLLIRKNPKEATSMLASANGIINNLPVDKSSIEMFTPLLNMNTLNKAASVSANNNPTLKTKRSVSETKKKYVAANQNWTCASCKKQLPGSFEIDHIIRLEQGGSNDISNLRAMCRNCHGEKTALENL